VKQASGLSVIELIVVTTILGILIALGGGWFSSDRMRVNQAAQILSADVTRARLESLRRNVPVGIRFSFASGTNRYEIVADTDQDGLDNEDLVISRTQFGAGEWGRVLGGLRQCTAADAAASTSAEVVFDARGVYQLATSRSVQLSIGSYSRFININQQGRAQIRTACP
jgi:type IV fimbrial biogenesis protein FimT